MNLDECLVSTNNATWSFVALFEARLVSTIDLILAYEALLHPHLALAVQHLPRNPIGLRAAADCDTAPTLVINSQTTGVFHFEQQLC